MPKLFCECIKDATSRSTHVVTALGNERKRRQTNQMMAQDTMLDSMKYPDVGLSVDDDVAGDIVRGSEFRMPFEVKKMVPDQQLIFGWASVVEKDGKLIVDKQGDMIPVEELENAAYDFVLHSRDHGDMHRQMAVGKMVESMVFTREKQKALGVDLGMVGWWVGFKINNSEVWDAHKRGDRLEFSIGGAAVPIEVTEKRGGQRRFSRFPFDERASRDMHLTIARLFRHQREKLLFQRDARVIEEDDDVLRSTQQLIENHLARATQRTGSHAVESVIGHAVRSDDTRLRLLHSTIATNVDDWARGHARERAAGLLGRSVSKADKGNIQRTSRELADRLVKEAIDKDWSVRRLEKELDKTGLFDPGRAEMIARTEISAAQNKAMLKAGYEFNDHSDRQVRKIWLLGPNPCPICEENGEETLELDETFSSGDFTPPVHPNCMCEVQLIY